MTQHSANKFCQWLSMKTGHFYRLPTEAEWEYACRAGGESNYTWGDARDKASQFAWFGGNEDSHYHPLGKKRHNAFGLHDMHGNVLEWTLDQYVSHRRQYFGKRRVVDPWIKATKPYPHVTKGGHWRTQTIAELSAAARFPSLPEWKKSEPMALKTLWHLSDVDFMGFRVVRPKEIPTVEEMYHYWNSGVEDDGDMAIWDD